MPIIQLDINNFEFPKSNLFPKDSDGVVAIGGDTDPKRLLNAYASGIFPWPHEDYPLLWFSPDPRFVLDLKLDDFKTSKSLDKFIKKNNQTQNIIIKFDTNFREVMLNCAYKKRPDQDGTWITDDILAGYCDLHELGFAHSVEAYLGTQLVGGLYGVSLGSAFFGESMFSKISNASKLCFVSLVQKLESWDFDFIDCQQETGLLKSFGAKNISRKVFLEKLGLSNQNQTNQGPWT